MSEKNNLPPELKRIVDKLRDKPMETHNQLQHQLYNCPKPHNFPQKLDLNISSRAMCQCTKCGIEIPATYAMWYNQGLQDANIQKASVAKK